MGQNISFPRINVPILSATTPIENSDQKVLFVGQSLPEVLTPTLFQNISNSESDINTLFGEGSILARMLIDARDINTVCEFDVLAVPEAGGSVAAVSTLTITGSSTDAGSIEIVIENAINGVVTVTVPTAQTNLQVGVLIQDAINANTAIAYTALDSGAGDVDITFDHSGTIGNQVGISLVNNVPGITIDLEGFLTDPDGVGGPDLTGAFDLIGEERYQTIAYPYSDQIDTVKDFLDGRFNADDTVLDGVAIVGFNGDFDTSLLLGNPANNSQSLVVLANEFDVSTTNDESPAIFESPWSICSQFSSVRALRRQPDANISRFVISRNGALDATGGPALSSKPYANTPFFNLPVVPVSKGFLKSEIADLANAGVSVLGNNRARNTVIAGQIVTTYKTDTAGSPDDSFKFLNYVDTASTGREYFFNNLEQRFAQTRLTDGNLIRGRDMTNDVNIRAVMVGFYQTLADEDYVVARKGEDILQFFKQNLTVVVELITGTANITFSLPIVTQLRQINAPMQLTFNIE